MYNYNEARYSLLQFGCHLLNDGTAPLIEIPRKDVGKRYNKGKKSKLSGYCRVNRIYTEPHMEKQQKLYVFKRWHDSFQFCYPVSVNFITGLIINELISEQRINIIWLYVGILVLSSVFSIFGQLIYKQTFELNLKIQSMFYHLVSQMDYETPEIPSVQDMQNRAQDTMRSSLAIVDQIVNLCSAIISIVLMGTITTLHPVIIFFSGCCGFRQFKSNKMAEREAVWN